MTMERDDKEKDRDKERQRERERGGGREKERDKDREKVKLKEKEKEKERDLEKKERGGGKDLEKERAHDKEKLRERGAGKDKERGGSGGKDLEKERASEKEREREKDRAKDQDRDRRKEREKEREKEKEREREKEKKREHSKKEKEREKDKEKDRAKEREREREKVGEREKDREKIVERAADNDREKEREREVREREREREVREKERERELREKENEREKLRAREKERDGREKERDHDRDNKHKDWPERDRERVTGTEHEAEQEEKEKNRDERDRPSNEHGSRPSASELEERIAKMREERHKASAEQRASAKKTDADNDISAWVNKSRKIEQKKKIDDRQKAARMAKILAEQDNEEDDDNSGDELTNSAYGTRDLAGLKIRHGFDKVMEGHAVVLTLKDTNVLDGDDVNLAGDELESIEMAEQQAREDAYKAAKKKPGSYEDKFGNDMDALVTRTILPQYDDAVKDEGMVLDANGGLSEESRKKLEEVRLRLEGSSAKESLIGTSAKPVSDYFTEEDMLQFKKPKNKKKLRKKEKLDIDELEAEAVAAGLGSGDLGARDSEGRRAQQLADAQAEAESRKNAYQNALNKAEDASMILRKESTVEAMEVDKADSPVYVGDDDEDFYKSLDRARQAALKNQRNSGNSGGGAQAVVARLSALQQDAVSSSQSPVGVEAQEGGLVFTDTGEFCRSLQLDDAIIRRAGPKDVFGEEEEEAPVEETEKDTSKVAGGWTEIVDVEMKTEVGGEESDGGDPGEEPIAEVSVGKGLAGALSLLKERGTLKETVDWGGRNMDKKRSKLVGIVDESNNQVGQRDILLDRVDEFGRTMTPKEAFRKLSHKFHGKGPGKMKQEKKMKQYQEELRLKQMNSGDTPLMSMEKMREAQARMHTPYIVISGHIKPGQTSDPRSGFGTVEKEPIGSLTPMLGDKSAGSLTPMLGDKKVEHFLGIKRKPESGFKEPPSKQPKYEH
ncbi:unnamed protein product [Calypogeia fissa]